MSIAAVAELPVLVEPTAVVDALEDDCTDCGGHGEIQDNPSPTGDPQAAISRPCPNPACDNGKVVTR